MILQELKELLFTIEQDHILKLTLKELLLKEHKEIVMKLTSEQNMNRQVIMLLQLTVTLMYMLKAIRQKK